MRRLLGSLERSLLVLNAIADGVTAQDKNGLVIYANDAAAHISGYPSGEAMIAAPPTDFVARFEILDEHGNTMDFSQLPGRLALLGHTAERILRYRNRETGEQRWSVVKAQPVYGANGEVELAVNIFRDITAQKKQERLQHFLIEAGKILAASLDYETTLANVARLATPQIADWCSVHLVNEQGLLEQVVVAHVDPEQVAWIHELQQQYPPPPDRETGVAKVIKSGQTEYLPRITDEQLLAAAAEDAQLLRILREMALRSSVVVPLTARGRTLGAITLVTGAKSGRYLTAEDVALAEELGRVAGLAVDNARLYFQAQAERERFEVILRSIGDAVIVTDAEGQIVFINEVAAVLTGWHSQSALGKNVAEVFRIVNETTREPVRIPLMQAIEEGVVVGLANHTLLIAKDGFERPINDSGAPIRDPDGNLIGAVLVFRDFTAERQAELTLQASEQRYRTLVENATDMIYTLDLEGNLTSLNHAGEVMTGYTQAELLNTSIARLIRADDHSLMQQMLARKMQGTEQTRYELELHTKSGEPLTLEVNSRLAYHDGKPVGIQGIARNITARKQAERHQQLLQEFTIKLATALTSYQVTELIMETFRQLSGQSFSSIFRLSTDGQALERVDTSLNPQYLENYPQLSLATSAPMTDAVRNQQVVWIESQQEYLRLYPRFTEEIQRLNVCSVLCLPFFSAHGVTGGIYIALQTTQQLTLDERNLLFAMAQVCGQALERVQLSEQAQQMVVVEERHRLARELHDAVSQTLFSATTMAEAVAKGRKRDPEQVVQLMEQVVILNRSAMAEMRTLLLELRPETILRSKLSELLRQLIESVKGRRLIETTFEVNGDEIVLPSEVHLAFYRMAQESLNNAMKHSQAKNIYIRYSQQPTQVVLNIADDGQGFDTQQDTNGLGLISLRERAQAIGADIQIMSQPGQGTQVIVEWELNA